MIRSWAYNRFGVLMGTSSRASCPRWPSLRGNSWPMITLFSSQGDFCATARSHISDFNFDEALGLFAGLNILPKTTFATDYSYRTQREHQHRLLAGWLTQVAPLLLPEASTFCLDFHPIPYRGDPTGLDAHYITQRGQAGTSVLTFF